MRTKNQENVELKTCWCLPIKHFDLAAAYSTDVLTAAFIFDGKDYRIDHDAVEEVPDGVCITHRELILSPPALTYAGETTVFTVCFSNVHSLIHEMTAEEYLTVEVEHTLDGIVNHIALTKKTSHIDPSPLSIS